MSFGWAIYPIPDTLVHRIWHEANPERIQICIYIYIYVYIHSHVFRVEHQDQEDQGPYHDNITVSIKHVVSKEPWYVSSFSGLVAASMNQGIATRVQQSIMYQFVHILKEKITPTQLGPSLARWVLVASGLGDTYAEAVGILCQLLSGKTTQERYATWIEMICCFLPYCQVF